MNSRDSFINTRVATAYASTAISSSDGVKTGAAIDITKAIGLKLVLEVSAWTAGTIGIQDVQFANDSSFTENVTTITSDEILMKNDRSSSTSAVAQTVLGAVGRRTICIENRATNGQKYARVRGIAASSAALTANIIALIEENKGPVVQA